MVLLRNRHLSVIGSLDGLSFIYYLSVVFFSFFFFHACCPINSAVYTISLEIIDNREETLAVFGPLHCQVLLWTNCVSFLVGCDLLCSSSLLDRISNSHSFIMNCCLHEMLFLLCQRLDGILFLLFPTDPRASSSPVDLVPKFVSLSVYYWMECAGYIWWCQHPGLSSKLNHCKCENWDLNQTCFWGKKSSQKTRFAHLIISLSVQHFALCHFLDITFAALQAVWPSHLNKLL